MTILIFKKFFYLFVRVRERGTERIPSRLPAECKPSAQDLVQCPMTLLLMVEFQQLFWSKGTFYKSCSQKVVKGLKQRVLGLDITWVQTLVICFLAW